MLVVTGHRGNVGAELTRSLLQRDPSTYCIAAHHPERVAAEFGEDMPVRRFAYDDRSTWDEALDGITSLFLLFPLPKPSTARKWMVPFVQAAAAAGAQHIVYVSTLGADRMKVNPHHRVERAIESSGSGYTLLRCSYFMQNLHRAISTHGVDIAEHGELFVPAGKGKTTFVDARDVAEVALLAFDDPAAHLNVAYALAGPETLDFDEVAAILSEVLDRPIRYTHPSMVRFWRRMHRRGVTLDTIFFMSIVYTLARRGSNVVESEDLARLLGRRPTDLRTWAERTRWRWEEQQWT